MAINRTETFYPRNDTTIDTGTGIDIRILSTTQSGTNDVTQTCTADHTNDNVNRWFDPATTGNTDATDINTTLVKRGWALRLTEDMTPPDDDTNCNVIIPANTTTVTLDVGASWSGGAITGNTVPTFKASLWRYNPSTDAGTLIAAGTSAATTWQNLTQNGTFKTVPISITVPQTTFSQGEILMVQVGMNTGTLPNPITGTTNWVFTLRINNATTNVAFASGSHLLQVCTYTNNLNGVGTPTRNGLAITPTSYNMTALATPTYTRVPTIAKTFSMIASAIASRSGLLAIVLPRNLTALGTPSMARQVSALRAFNLSARGEIISYNRVLAMGRAATALGTIAYSKQVTASKSFNLGGIGTPTFSKFTIANRTFDMTARGEILTSGPNASTISMPIDEVPTGEGGSGPTYIFPVLD